MLHAPPQSAETSPQMTKEEERTPRRATHARTGSCCTRRCRRGQRVANLNRCALRGKSLSSCILCCLHCAEGRGEQKRPQRAGQAKGAPVAPAAQAPQGRQTRTLPSRSPHAARRSKYNPAAATTPRALPRWPWPLRITALPPKSSAARAAPPCPASPTPLSPKRAAAAAAAAAAHASRLSRVRMTLEVECQYSIALPTPEPGVMASPASRMAISAPASALTSISSFMLPRWPVNA